MPDRIYLNVISDFDRTGYMRPRIITWEDGRKFKIEEIREHRQASAFRKDIQGDCYTVVIKGQVRHLFFEKTSPRFPHLVGRWFVEKEK